ncbi:phosphoribosylformylglycinamidine synthase [Nitrosovibrio sp. Nv17]|uniref:phosphoribosylformylglycinamidine synthase n=1 Tax=Nitrosovibrio sp. Nv17 TaxID=1855339 RepID=UPI000908B26E|nr:phosphoribosylformylglycinamidine synthase [Nitrosovibrio sp. Nv17]SFW26970.1 phosphoribosylformylglycinamidine synthase [Nitrosovibrio sp. Nv17]
MLRFRGGSALSPFRLEKLTRVLEAAAPQVSHICARHWHFCTLRRSLDADRIATLEHLLESTLDEGGGNGAAEREADELLLVLPRPGTVSPWSSKATDIAHRCGLEAVARLERGVAFHVRSRERKLSPMERQMLIGLIHDRMTEAVFDTFDDAHRLFSHVEPASFATVDLLGGGIDALRRANEGMGLALSQEEIDYFAAYFLRIGRDPTDVELMMFAQANSEHCRHKIFNADWVVDGVSGKPSLFSMIRNTHRQHPGGTVVAYADNAAIIEGGAVERFYPGPGSVYGYAEESTHLLLKVETHNHPTAISPYPGAATGVGGEIRDEGATGRGGQPRSGLSGFSVSHLRIPDLAQPWEACPQPDGSQAYGRPSRIASALEIMLEGPIGSAAFGNEFGRPNLAGYFRTYEARVAGEMRGYHKPVMLAGGMGHVAARHAFKEAFPDGAPVVQLGGPGMLIGLGGGAASSMDTGANAEQLDFDSVQRGNAEMERRAQEVIDRCCQMERQGVANPILSIHDVGAGGLSNALPELLHGAGRGGRLDLRDIPSEEPGMSPMQIWSNEAQERYVLALQPGSLALFRAICERERCPFAVVGTATAQPQLVVTDAAFDSRPVDMDLPALLGKPPRMVREAAHRGCAPASFDVSALELREAAYRVLQLPAVADKTFLITIGDRSVGGMTARDQMVGPWQVPVADVAVTLMGYRTCRGEACAVGERAPLALIDAAAAARMAVAEAITNLAAAPIEHIAEIKLSANWMAAAGHPGEDAVLFDAVHAVGMEFCPRLGISIPVGKDSMSMKTVWEEPGGDGGKVRKEVIAPLTLVVSAFARVTDARRTLTPQLRLDCGETELILIDLGEGRNRLGGSALAQVHGQMGSEAPDLAGQEGAERLKAFFAAIQRLNREGRILAYHDRSDGGLFVTLCEMAFAGRAGLAINLDQLCFDAAASDIDGYELRPEVMNGRFRERILAALFSEEAGAVIQIRSEQRQEVMAILSEASLSQACFVIGTPNGRDDIRFLRNNRTVLAEKRVDLHRAWSATTHAMQALRDDPECARQEYDRILDAGDPGLHAKLSFSPDEDVAAPFVHGSCRPRIAILREQGVNGHVEMAAAFDRAGFAAIDVHMSDIASGRVSLADYRGFAACGGFSYGDVLGAGRGWAGAILCNPRVRDAFEAFFHRSDTFALGVCNGCQMMSALREIIPGAQHWPRFVRNRSEQFEARLVMVEIPDGPSLFFDGMGGSRLPVVVAHGEGRAEFAGTGHAEAAASLVALRFVDNRGAPTETYPYNPSGSPCGIAGMTTPDGRFSILMPHPERGFRAVQYSWQPGWDGDAPWMRMFGNVRRWVG